MNSTPTSRENTAKKPSMIQAKTFYFKPRNNDVINFAYKMGMNGGCMSSRDKKSQAKTEDNGDADKNEACKSNEGTNVNVYETRSELEEEHHQIIETSEKSVKSTDDNDNLDLKSVLESAVQMSSTSPRTPSPPFKRSYSLGESKIILRDIFSRILSPIPEESSSPTKDSNTFLEDFCEGIAPPVEADLDFADQPILKPVTKIPKNFLVIDEEILALLKNSPLYDQIISRSLAIQKLVNERRAYIEIETKTTTKTSSMTLKRKRVHSSTLSASATESDAETKIDTEVNIEEESDSNSNSTSTTVPMINIVENSAEADKKEEVLTIKNTEEDIQDEKSTVIYPSKSYKRARRS